MRRLGSSTLLRLFPTSFGLVPSRTVEAACTLLSCAELASNQPAQSIMARMLTGLTCSQAFIGVQSLSECHHALHASPPGVASAGQRRQQRFRTCSLGNSSLPTTRHLSAAASTADRQSAGSSDEPSQQTKRYIPGADIYCACVCCAC